MCGAGDFDHLLGATDDASNFAVGQTLPNQDGNLNLFRSQALASSHDWASSLLNMAMASFTRFRPSRMPAHRNHVLKCCLTVRGADVQLAGDLLVAAALYEQVQYLLITRGYFYGRKMNQE